MTIEEILDKWKKDSRIDSTALDDESLKISVLHHDYLRILTNERLRLKTAKHKLREFESTLYQYYKGDYNSDVEKLKEINRQPWQQRILKQEIKEYVDNDKEVVDIRNRISIIEEKVEVLSEIMKSLHNRSYQITNAINFKELIGGM